MQLSRMPLRVRAGLAALLALAALATFVIAASSHSSDPSAAARAFDADSPRFTLAVVPDTQYLLDQDRGDSEPVDDALQWIVDRRTDQNIAFTSGLGDITQDGTAEEMARADAAYRILDDARAPYSVVAGNHDINSSTDDQRGDSAYLRAFGPRRFKGDPTFGGASADGYNQFHVFRAAGRDWLVLALDWRLSDSGFAWAQSVLDAHPRTPAIVTTHELVNNDDGAGDASLSGYGQRLWDRLIRRNDQIFLTLNGHFWPVGRTVLRNDFGHEVRLDLTNYQDRYYGGAGMIRTYAFDLARRTIDVSTFSPYLLGKDWDELNPLGRELTQRTGADDRYSLPIDFEQRFGAFDPQPAPQPLATNQLLAPGTVALWRPQQDTASVPDLSGNGNDLTRATLDGTGADALRFAADEYAPAQPTHGSLRFDGSKNPGRGSYLRTADSAPLNRMRFRDGYTIEAFFKLPPNCCGGHDWMGLLGQMGTGRDVGRTQSDPDEGIVALNLSGGGELQWAVWPLNRPDNTTAWGHLQQGAEQPWHHVAIVNDGRFTSVYVDQSLISRNPLTPAQGLSSSGRPWLLGASNYGNVVEQTFNGWIGDVRIVDHALSVGQFMSVRGERVGVTAARASLSSRSLDVTLERADADADDDENGRKRHGGWGGWGGSDRLSGTVRVEATVPRDGSRFDLGTTTWQLDRRDDRDVLQLRLDASDRRALAAAGDGVRVELTLARRAADGTTLRDEALLRIG